MRMCNNIGGRGRLNAARFVYRPGEEDMSARFSKLEAVDLADDEDTEEEGGSGEDCQVALVLPEGVRKGGRGRRLVNKLRGRKRLGSWRWVVVAVVGFAIAVFVALMVARLASEPPSQATDNSDNNGELQAGAVATDSALCSEMSGEILRNGGSAVDAAITALLCVGAVHPESSGLGGGGFMVVYDSNGSAAAIDFRESAPAAATTDMFHSNPNLSTSGGLAVAVPGELRGMELAHRLYGRLKWSDLFQPVINLCRTGFNLSLHTEKAIKLHEDAVREDKILTELFVVNGELKKEGDGVKRSRLADTLGLIAKEGADVFYTGELSLNIINKVNETGGILTPEDLASYGAILKKTLSAEFNGYTLFTPPPPSGGSELLFPLNILSLYPSSSSSSSSSSCLMYHRMVEAFKFMFALRSQLGDTECDDCDGDAVWRVVNNMTSINYAAYVKSQISDDATHNVSYYHADYATPPSDHGTSHISVLGPDGMAVSVTSSVNTYFGSKVVTEDGVILNNEMDDFSSPNITNSYGLRPSESNYISPGKRPLSSTCPVVAVKRSESGGTQYLITGASGGTRIPTATAQVIWRVLSLNEPIDEAIEGSRLHHQLVPNQVQVEGPKQFIITRLHCSSFIASFPDDIITYLESKGHNVTKDSDYAVVQGVHVNEVGVVSAHSDSRKRGQSVVVT